LSSSASLTENIKMHNDDDSLCSDDDSLCSDDDSLCNNVCFYKMVINLKTKNKKDETLRIHAKSKSQIQNNEQSRTKPEECNGNQTSKFNEIMSPVM